MKKLTTYKCEVCKGIFKSDTTPAESEKQLRKEFPSFEVEDCGIVCEDCFNKIYPKIPKDMR